MSKTLFASLAFAATAALGATALAQTPAVVVTPNGPVSCGMPYQPPCPPSGYGDRPVYAVPQQYYSAQAPAPYTAPGGVRFSVGLQVPTMFPGNGQNFAARVRQQVAVIMQRIHQGVRAGQLPPFALQHAEQERFHVEQHLANALSDGWIQPQERRDVRAAVFDLADLSDVTTPPAYGGGYPTTYGHPGQGWAPGYNPGYNPGYRRPGWGPAPRW